MTGEFLAVLAAFAYGLAGVSIMRAKSVSRGDSGVFFSIVLTAILSFCLWAGWGTGPMPLTMTSETSAALIVFAVAGLLSNVVGRQSMYRATEMVGAVRAGLLRRLTPLFALPSAFFLLGQQPDGVTLLGGAAVLLGVAIYLGWPVQGAGNTPIAGLVLGGLSALAYALAYSFRGLGLVTLPDAALGAFVGALVAAIVLFAGAVVAKGPVDGWTYLTVDRRARHWQTAVALSAGQLLQFFALKTATVLSVAVLGTLEVLFSALIILLVTKCETIAIVRLGTALVITAGGTVLLFLSS